MKPKENIRYPRVVIKLGTGVLTAGTDRLNRPRMVDLVRQIAFVRELGCEVILVSSGAVSAGWEALNFPQRKKSLSEKQLFAAVGQSRLMNLYAQLAEIYGLTVAQTLLTRDDLRDRRRYLNARNTFLNCIERGVLPIVNENDVVAVDEIKVGDNDNLSALVASLVSADLLLICSDIEGLYTADPRANKNTKLIEEVKTIDENIWGLAGEAGTHHGTGGMRTKIQAADLATRSGIETIIAAGDLTDVIIKAALGQKIGTRFHARNAQRIEARKRWILAETVRTSKVIVDRGAEKALLEQGRSLLPAGIIKVEGTFERGQTVCIYAQSEKEIARGLTQYKSADLILIAGKKSSQIETILGYEYGAEVVHRDDMVLVS